MSTGRSLQLAFVVFSLLATQALGAIPSRPGGETVVLDAAGLLEPDDRRLVESVQRSTLAADGVPIVVVTVATIEAHAPGASIEELARRWFAAWGIGAGDPNLGILLLISEQDRKARIELGAGWGRRWDGYARSVMQEEIVPGFRSGTPSVGILQGVVALSAMAGLDPAATPVTKAAAQGATVAPGPTGADVDSLIIGTMFGALVCFLVGVAWIGRRERSERAGEASSYSNSSWFGDGGGAGFGSGIDWGGGGSYGGGGSSYGGGFSGGGSSGGGGATGSW